jgi:hypothetical protein
MFIILVAGGKGDFPGGVGGDLTSLFWYSINAAGI